MGRGLSWTKYATILPRRSLVCPRNPRCKVGKSESPILEGPMPYFFSPGVKFQTRARSWNLTAHWVCAAYSHYHDAPFIWEKWNWMLKYFTLRSHIPNPVSELFGQATKQEYGIDSILWILQLSIVSKTKKTGGIYIQSLKFKGWISILKVFILFCFCFFLAHE